ncbi:LSM_domain-containing protein [Hexamita inflata]|uniref:LSM domain-containing protein n=1 Tax=Hexamita inflata TaxID=28002 RepID=A0AA86UQ24_9EUKA|nr:LSM domain-containing protein [Hexamita inflata]
MDINSATDLLKIALQEKVKVYITDGSEIIGQLIAYDEQQNLVLKNATTKYLGIEKHFQTLFIRANNLKFLSKLDLSKEM